MEYKRKHLDVLIKRVNQNKRFIQVLTGPRQVGKTTIIKQLSKSINTPYTYVIAENTANSTTWIIQQWEAARLKLKASNSNSHLLIIDEIQKISNWSETVKQLWDTDTFNELNLEVILLGSSGLMIQQGLNESLAGRFELLKIPHWCFNEMNECFGITHEQYAWFGGYPGSMAFIKNEKRWKEYVKTALIETTISKDVLMLTTIHKPALMKQVFEMGVHYSSKILSYTKMLGQLQDAGNTVTISHYLNLLNVAGLLTGLQKFYNEPHRKKSSSPKWQVKNTALCGALSSESFKQVSNKNPVKWDQVIESAIGAHLINMADQGGYEIYYWRHKNDEVDYVLQKGQTVIAIEVKSGLTKPTKGMHNFRIKYNPHKVLLVGTSGLLWQEFLEINPGDLFD
ncbi:MAG: ATP-binding protein [Cyclobacteriaceae bacterium]|nr:ATP-binding protein [Cyclobacteriaceae bacterium]